jgi:hypothetical protein
VARPTFSTSGSERYRAAWRMFCALEASDSDLLDSITDEYPPEDLLSGMGLVAARLRVALREHAVDCDCGSDRWLEDEGFHQALHDLEGS